MLKDFRTEDTLIDLWDHSSQRHSIMEENKGDRVRKAEAEAGGEFQEAESSSKKLKTGEDDFVPTPSDVESTAVVIPASSTESGEQREAVCIVCMEEGSAESPLLESHQCGQCSKDAWKICACCNETILSRICPVCRGNYAPICLHVVPGVPISQLADKTLSAEAKSMLLYKFGIIRQLIGKSNVAVWNPDQEKMHFSLPREFSEGTNEVSCLTVSIPMTADRIVNNTFTFNNTVWDEIESEVENGATATGEMRDSNVAVQWLLSFTRHAGHQILSMMSEADWEHTLDPAKSEDTAAALQSIQSNIVLGGAKKPVAQADAGAEAGAQM